MARSKKIIVEKGRLTRSEVIFRAGVMVGESYKGLCHILRYEGDVDVVREALELAYKRRDERKVRLLKRKVEMLSNGGAE